MPGIHSFDHLVVRVEDFDAGVAAFSDLAGLAHRESGENPDMVRLCSLSRSALSALSP